MTMKSEKRSKDILDKYFNEVCGDKAVKEEIIQILSKKIAKVSVESEKKNLSDVEQEVVEHFDKAIHVSMKSVRVNIKPNIAKEVEHSIKIYNEKKKSKNYASINPNSFNQSAGKSYSKKHYPLPVGTVITHKGDDFFNHYVIERFLKQGGFGMTYLVRLKGQISPYYVIKEFCPNATNRILANNHLDIDYKDIETYNQWESFKSEPDRILELKKKWADETQNFNLVMTVTSAFEFKFEENIKEGNWYYVMEYVPGNSLHHIMQSFENDDDAFAVLPYKSRFRIMDQLCNALYHLHDINCVHQDISPNNMMVSFDTEGEPNLKVIDFGLATGLNHQNESSISFVNKYGTKGFCDSQNLLDDIYVDLQKNGQGDKLKLLDVYSLGAVLGYLFLEDIKSIKESNFGEKYNIRLQNMRPKQDLIFDENDSLEFKALKSQLFLIHNLVCQATVKNLDERIKSVESFRTYLNLIEKIDANFIQNLEADFGSLVDNREGDSDDINTGGQGVNNAGKDDVVKVTENEDKKSDKEPYKPSGIKSLFNKIKTKWYVIFSVLVVGLIMVFVITRPEPPITIEYLNEVFIAAQHNDSAAKQRIKEIIDDKVRINYIEGETLFYTYDLSTFLTKGNNEYIIGKTHKINRFNTGPDGKVITIVLEELN